MRKIVSIVALALMISSIALANETVKLAIGDWPPFTSEKDTKAKLLEKVVTEAFKKEGIDVQYAYFPWKRSYVLVENGEFDGTFPWKILPEREKVFYINKEAMITDPTVFFHLKTTSFDWNTLDDLNKYRVGVTLGYSDEEIYKAKGIKADPAPSEDLNFKKMLAGRIDVYQTSKTVGYATINNIFKPEQAKLFTNNPKPVEESDYFILFSRKAPNGQKIADKFDSGLKKLKESGEYDKILAEYLGSSSK